MLVRTMKPSGAAVVFLAVINLLTVSSSSTNETDSTSSQKPGLQDLSTASTSASLISTGAGKYQSSPTVDPTSLSVDTVNASRTSTSRSPSISSVPHSPTEQTPVAHTTDELNKDVNGSTVASDKMSSAATEKDPNAGAGTTLLIPEVHSKEASTGPSTEAQTQPPIDGEESNKLDVNNSSSDADKMSATGNMDSTKQDSHDSSSGAGKTPATSNKGIKIGAGCVAAVIGVIVLVVIYKICQKKSPATENTEVKASAETKENVKLLSVKTETPNSDMKRTSSNQMECIEC